MTAIGETFGRYQLDASLERPAGSVTEVFRATDTEGGFEVVIAIVRSDATSIERARFATRGRRLLQIKHASLMTALDVGTTHCAFEAPAGARLSVHAGIAAARSRQKLFWLSQLAGALAALHKGGVVHGQMGLDEVVVLPDGAVKLTIPLGGDISPSPLDDVRAFGVAASRLLLGDDADGESEPHLAERLAEAGLPADAAAIIARVRAGQAVTSADLAEKLAPFTEYSGPTTEPLLPIMTRRRVP